MKEYIYICERSIEGLLSAIFEAYYSHDKVLDITFMPDDQCNLFGLFRHIPTNTAHAIRVQNAIVKKISPTAMEMITLCWLSEQPGCGKLILDFVRMGFKTGPSVCSMLANDTVHRIYTTQRRVSCETHRMLGLCRFKETKNGVFVCTISPDHHQLPLISDHFAARMPKTRWLIYDESRGLASFGFKGKWYIMDFQPGEIQYAPQLYEALWQEYFDTIAIQDRINPNLQRQFMPKRYWKHLVEKPGDPRDAASLLRT